LKWNLEHSQTQLRFFISLLFVFLFSRVAFADTLTDDFSTRNNFPTSSGELIANQALGTLHPPLQITSYKSICDGGTTSTGVDFGDGSHGSFDSTTYSRFGTIIGSGPYTLTINTDTYPVIYATDFTLDAAYTLTATGSQPLVIKALRDVTINGIIDCSGSAGTNAILGITNLAAGGSGKCGGGQGGNGATSSTAATSGGTGISTVLTGGAAGTGTTGAGGAGGSGHNWTAACGTPGTVATSGGGGGGGVAAGNYEDSAIRNAGGGAGGGGGARGTNYSGAGGGAGGGHVEIYALRDLTISNTGRINVSGGSGGTSAGDSGGGGGGASGTIKIIAGGTSTISNGGTNPKSLMTNGAGGTSTTGSAGGSGARGRIWIIDNAGENCFAPECDTNQNGGITTNPGTVEYKTGLHSSTSIAYDLNNHHTSLTLLSTTVLNAPNGTITLTAQGSKKGFGSDSTAFVLPGSIADLNGSRYVRYKVDINNTNTTAPIALDTATLTYTPGSSSSFNFSAGCGTIDPNSQQNRLISFFIFLLILIPFLILLIRMGPFKIKSLFH